MRQPPAEAGVVGRTTAAAIASAEIPATIVFEILTIMSLRMDRRSRRRMNSVAAGKKRLSRSVFANLPFNSGSGLTATRRQGGNMRFILARQCAIRYLNGCS
jgi:hypothetical protein